MPLYKRPGSKYYWMKFTLKGKLYQQSTRLKNKRDAENFEAAFRTALQMESVGIRRPVDAPTFGEAVKEFLEWSKVEHGLKSQARYKFACDPLLTFFSSTRKSDTFDREALEQYVTWRRGQASRKTKQGITRDTVNREIVILKKVLKRLHEAGRIPSNQWASFKLLPGNDLSFHVLTREEERLYLLACRPQLQDLATIMLTSGMRPSEILHLTKSSVFPDKGYVQVEKGKTKAARRRVPLGLSAIRVITARVNRFDGAFLFPQNDEDRRGPADTDSYDSFHREAIDKLGFTFRLYDCRHTFATRALEAGADLVTLAAILGHANLRMLSRYAHPSEGLKMDVIKAMEQRKSA